MSRDVLHVLTHCVIQRSPCSDASLNVHQFSCLSSHAWYSHVFTCRMHLSLSSRSHVCVYYLRVCFFIICMCVLIIACVLLSSAAVSGLINSQSTPRTSSRIGSVTTIDCITMAKKGGSCSSWGSGSWQQKGRQQQSRGSRKGATQAQDDWDDQPAAHKQTAEEVKEKLGMQEKAVHQQQFNQFHKFNQFHNFNQLLDFRWNLSVCCLWYSLTTNAWKKVGMQNMD